MAVTRLYHVIMVFRKRNSFRLCRVIDRHWSKNAVSLLFSYLLLIIIIAAESFEGLTGWHSSRADCRPVAAHGNR